MPKILAIVGRPNVGKSTLFNRIIGNQKAIVHDTPGVTRDRHYGTIEWSGRRYIVIDTGGYVPNSPDLFEKAIREQAEIAISEAGAVIFLVDATTGVTPLDRELADILRRSEKKIYLVVNKVDNDRRQVDATQFYELGLGEPIPVSALVGRNIGDFLDEVTRTLSGDEGDEKDTRLKLAVVGKPNVGKSSLVNALLGTPRNIVTPIPGTTRDSIDTVLKYQKEEILLIDTAGLRRKSRVKESIEFYSTLRALKAIERCDVALLLIDVETGIDRQDLRILETIVEQLRGVVLVANKWDLVEKDENTAKAYEKEIRKLLRIYDYIPVIFISALTKQRIYKVIELARTVYSEQQKRISTNKLNNILGKIIAATPPSSSSGKEIKINYITQVKINPPAIAFFTNEPKLIEDRYRRFLEKAIRTHFGFTGVPVELYFRKKN
jgi:GTPase